MRSRENHTTVDLLAIWLSWWHCSESVILRSSGQSRKINGEWCKSMEMCFQSVMIDECVRAADLTMAFQTVKNFFAGEAKYRHSYSCTVSLALISPGFHFRKWGLHQKRKWTNVSVKSKLQHAPPRAYPGHLTPLPSRGGGNLLIRVFQEVGNLIPML